MPGPLILVILVAVAVFGVYAWQQEQKRKEALLVWATARGWTLRTATRRGVDHDFPGLGFLARGRSRRAKNVVTGTHRGRPVTLFDYRYTTGSGKNKQTHRLGVVVVGTDHPVIPLTIRRENPFDKVGEFLGADDIDFESAEFSRTFFVKSGDRKWAYDVIHQRTMDYLLRCDFQDLAFGLFELAVHKRGRFDPDGYDRALDLACDVLDLIPDYVIRQMKGETK